MKERQRPRVEGDGNKNFKKSRARRRCKEAGFFFSFVFSDFISFHSTFRLKTPRVGRVQRLRVRPRSREHLLHVQTDVLLLSRWRSEPLPALRSSPSPLLSFHEHLFLRLRVGDTCVPAAPLTNRVTSQTAVAIASR